MNYVDALVSLCPTAKWVVRGGKDIEWLDTEQTQPTEEEIVQKIAELEYQEEINEYQRKSENIKEKHRKSWQIKENQKKIKRESSRK